MYFPFWCISFTIIRLHLNTQKSTRQVFSLYQFWYVHIVLYTIILPIHSIYLLLAFSNQEQQSFLLHSQLLSILFMIHWLPLKSQTSAPYVFSLYQFWYVHIGLYTIILPIHSIYLLLVFSNQEQQSFLIHCQLYYYNQKQEEVAIFSHTHISIGRCETSGSTIIETVGVIIFQSIMNCRINWSWNKRGVLQVFNSPYKSFQAYFGSKSLIWE